MKHGKKLEGDSDWELNQLRITSFKANEKK